MNDFYREAEQYIKASKKETQNCRKDSTNPRKPVSYAPILKKINNDFHKFSIPKELLPDPEWSHNLNQWFGYVRRDVNQMKKKKDIGSDEANETPSKKTPFSEVTQLIDDGKLPTTDVITNINDASGILFYFKKRHSDFSYSDLCWIFSALTSIDRLMLPEMCECIQIISSIIKKQICEGGDKNSKLYPYLSVINELIVKYFHQS